MPIVKDIDPLPGEWSAISFPPEELYSDEPAMETDLHLRQMILLIQCLEWLWRDRSDFYCTGNSTIYYSPHQRKSEDFRGPDFFVVLNTERKPRKSWVVWHENGKYPNVIVEILSKSTAILDRGLKKQIYQDIFRTPEYFWFDPETLEFAGFFLNRGHYQPIDPNPHNWLWSEELCLFLSIHDRQLRFLTRDGSLVPTPQESALAAEQERQRADRLAAKLKALGVDPDTV